MDDESAMRDSSSKYVCWEWDGDDATCLFVVESEYTPGPRGLAEDEVSLLGCLKKGLHFGVWRTCHLRLERKGGTTTPTPGVSWGYPVALYNLTLLFFRARGVHLRFFP